MASSEDLASVEEIAASEEKSESSDKRARWARRYPPLLSALGALFIAFFVLPSSLNLPQTNPTQTLEYAPVPPDDKKDDTPPQGNLASLGLAGSASLEGGDGAEGPGGAGPLPTLPNGISDNPTDYRCVGNPPRQTEDPLAPPCVAYFAGDNFGATYQGVSGDEIKIVLYEDGSLGTVGTSRGTETCPGNTLVDLVNDAPKPDECHTIRLARLWQSYFNQRYQTYGRYGHFFVYFGASVSSTTPETRRADAAEVYRRVQPFATVDFSSFSGGGDAFVDTMAKRGVLNFGSYIGQGAEFFERYPKLIWGFPPSLEIQGAQFGTVLCNKYVPLPVDHSDQFDGQPRKFGLVYTTDPGFDTLRTLKDQVMKQFEACGGKLATEPATFPTAGYAADTSTSNRYALEAMQRFQAAGVTTVIWPGGMETNFSKAAGQLNYHPEFVLAGDGQTDNEFAQQGYRGSHGQDQNVWKNAAVVSYQPLVPDDATTRICFQAQRSVDPNVPKQDASIGCDMYDNLRQIFIGIQVAGPRLGPTSIDRGFHAIPPVASPDLQIPACYYDAGDYTCVKDFIIGRWDPNGSTDARTPGCYRIVGHRRILLADVDRNNAMTGYDPTPNTTRSDGTIEPHGDPCLNFTPALQQNLGPPNPNDI